MNIKEFSYYVEEHIQEFLPEEVRESASVSVHPVRNANDMLGYGMMMQYKDENMLPAFNLEDAWQAYKNGVEMETVLRNLAELYEEYGKKFSVDVSLEYENVKDRVIFQLLNKEVNQISLKERIYTEVGQGFVKVYAIHQELECMGAESNIPITYHMMQIYGYDMEKICMDAERNTPQIYPERFDRIDQGIPEEAWDNIVKRNPDIEQYHVLSNQAGYRGAGVLFYNGMQKTIAERFGQNYYVVPTSIHEMLLVPESAESNPKILELALQGINEIAVPEEEFLFNKVLYYDREKEQLQAILPDMPDLQIEGKKKEKER